MPPSLAIGVAVVVAGNFCISVALNVQKLAHRRSQDGAFSSTPNKSDGSAHLTGYGERSPLLAMHSSDGVSPASAPSRSNDCAVSESERDPLATSAGDSRPKSSTTDNARDHSHWGGSSGALRTPVKQGEPPPPYWRLPIWWAGIATMALAITQAYAFAPASVVAPLGTVALISNCIVAPLILGEVFDKKDLLGILLAIIGAVAVVISGDGGSDESLSPPALQHLIARPAFVVYTCINCGLILLTAVLSRTTYADRLVFIDVGLCALLGSWTVISTKSFSSFLNLLFLECFTYWLTWIALGILIPTAVLQVIVLQKALRRFDSTQVVPIQFTLFILASIAGSAVLFGDFRTSQQGQLLNFALGVILILAGVWLLTQHEGEQDKMPQRSARGQPMVPRPGINPYQNGRPVVSDSSPSLDIASRNRRTPSSQHHMPSFSVGSLLLASPHSRFAEARAGTRSEGRELYEACNTSTSV